MSDESKKIVEGPGGGLDTLEYVQHLALRRQELRTDMARQAKAATDALEKIIADPHATRKSIIDAAKALLEERARSEDRCFGKAPVAVHVSASAPGSAPAGLIILPALEPADDE